MHFKLKYKNHFLKPLCELACLCTNDEKVWKMLFCSIYWEVELLGHAEYWYIQLYYVTKHCSSKLLFGLHPPSPSALQRDLISPLPCLHSDLADSFWFTNLNGVSFRLFNLHLCEFFCVNIDNILFSFVNCLLTFFVHFYVNSLP